MLGKRPSGPEIGSVADQRLPVSWKSLGDQIISDYIPQYMPRVARSTEDLCVWRTYHDEAESTANVLTSTLCGTEHSPLGFPDTPPPPQL